MHDCVPDPLFLCFVFSKVVFCTRCNPCQLIMASLLFLSGPLLNGLCLSQQRNSLNVSAQWHFERLWHERNLEQYGAISFRCCKIIWKDHEQIERSVEPLRRIWIAARRFCRFGRTQPSCPRRLGKYSAFCTGQGGGSFVLHPGDSWMFHGYFMDISWMFHDASQRLLFLGCFAGGGFKIW